MKKFFYTLTAPLCFVFVFGSCGNPSTPENIIKSVDAETESDYENEVTGSKSFVFEETGLSYDTPQTQNGEVVGVLRVPKFGSPWTLELIEDVDDNALFKIVDAFPPADSGVPDYYVKNIVINTGGSALDWGAYTISIKITNTEGAKFYKTLQFYVALTPAKFSKAPIVLPYITGEAKNKLIVDWTISSGAEGYKVYVGTDPENCPQTPYQTITNANTTTLEITDLDDDAYNGFLPDSTTYYVWIAAYNGSGDTLNDPVQRKTSDPVDSYWFAADGDHIKWWDSGADDYEFFKDSSGAVWMGYCTKGQAAQNPGGPNQRKIVYHESFDPVKVQADLPSVTMGHYTTQEDLTFDKDGKPAECGVFVVELTTKPNYGGSLMSHYAVYYWGHKTIQTADVRKQTPDKTSVANLQGTVHSYLSEAWCTRSAAPVKYNYTPSFRDAMENYTMDNFKWYVAFVAIPWYPINDQGKWMFGYEG